jgi:hypothetical protein
MIYGMIVVSMISYYFNSYYNGILINYPIKEQVLDLFAYLIMASLMGVAVYAAGVLQFAHHWTMLLVQITTGMVVYLLLCRVFRLQAFMEIWEAGWNKIKTSGVKVSSI